LELGGGDVPPAAISLRTDLAGTDARVECRAAETKHSRGFADLETKRLCVVQI
jgi:hypothetical protein